MTIRDIINEAFENGLIEEPPMLCSMFIWVDIDGLVASCPVTNEFLHDGGAEQTIDHIVRNLIAYREGIKKGAKPPEERLTT